MCDGGGGELFCFNHTHSTMTIISGRMGRWVGRTCAYVHIRRVHQCACVCIQTLVEGGGGAR